MEQFFADEPKEKKKLITQTEFTFSPSDYENKDRKELKIRILEVF